MTWCSRRPLHRAVAVAACVVVPTPAWSQQLPGTGLRITTRVAIGRSDTLGTIIAGALRPDGTPCVIDYSNTRVVCYTTAGRRLWTSGGKGEGPGEFALPYRMTATAGDSLVVYDLAARTLTWLDPDGRFVRRRGLPIGFSQLNSIVSLDSGRIALSGRAPAAGPSADSAVFVLDRDLKLAAAFGALPAARNPQVLNYWGAGPLRRVGSDQLAYVRGIPGEFLLYGVDGSLRARWRIDAQLTKLVDEAYDISTSPTSLSVGRSSNRVASIWNITAVTDTVVLLEKVVTSGSRRGAEREWLFYSLRGHPLGVVTPEFDAYLIGMSADRKVIWGVGTDQDEPTLWRLSLESNP